MSPWGIKEVGTGPGGERLILLFSSFVSGKKDTFCLILRHLRTTFSTFVLESTSSRRKRTSQNQHTTT